MNWGIIGLGNMAKKFAISINQLENTALLGISSSSFFKRKKFGFKFNIKNNIASISIDQLYINLKMMKVFSIAMKLKIFTLPPLIIFISI